MSIKIREKVEIRYKAYDQNQVIELPILLKELVKDNALVQIIDEVVESIDLDQLSQYYSSQGCPSYHPYMMLKVWLYGFCNKVYTCRVLASKLREDLGFIYLSGHQQPCFKTLSEFRSNRMQGMVDDLFKELLVYLLERGYIDLEDLYVDGTMLAANANKYKIVWAKNSARWKAAAQQRAQQLLLQARALQAKEDEAYGNKDLAHYQSADKLAVELSSARLRECISAINEKAAALSEKKSARKFKSLSNRLSKERQKIVKYEKQQTVLAGRNSYSKTDEDATALRMKDETLKPGYNVQITTSNQYILNTSVHATGSDSATFKSHMQHLENQLEQLLAVDWKASVTTDAGYGSQEVYAYLEEKGHTAYVKYFTWYKEHSGQLAKDPYRRENWPWDEQAQHFTCPQGRKLVFKEKRDDTTKTGYLKHYHVYESQSCQGCEVFKQCRGEKAAEHTNRQVWISWDLEAYKEKARALLASPTGKAKRSQRGQDVETPFGNIKYNRNYARFILRGKEKVYIEACLLSISHNLIKLACHKSGKWKEYYAQRAAKRAQKAKKRA